MFIKRRVKLEFVGKRWLNVSLNFVKSNLNHLIHIQDNWIGLGEIFL